MNPEQPREVTYAGDTLRVTLRSSGCARIAGAFFMLLFLIPWAFGEAFAINMLLAVTGIDIRAPFPLAIPSFRVGWPSLLPIAFLVVWLIFWTIGGIGSISEVLRLLAGWDSIALKTSEWSVTRSFFLFTRTQTFRRADGWSAEIRRRDRALIARRESKTKPISSFGTPGERTWVANEITRRFGKPVRSTRDLPLMYESAPQHDGSVIIRRTAKARRGAIGCGVFALLVVNVPLVFWINYAQETGIPLGTGTAITAAFGIALSLLGIWSIMGHQYWIVRRDYLAERMGVFGLQKQWEFRGAALEIETHNDSDGDEHFNLIVRDNKTGRSKKLVTSMNEETDPLLFGRFVEKHTGWRLVLPPTLVSS